LAIPRIAEATEAARAANLARRPKARVTALIQALRNDGYGLRRIARALNEANIRPQRGHQWYPSTIKDQLANWSKRAPSVQ
jgi:Recombinase